MYQRRVAKASPPPHSSLALQLAQELRDFSGRLKRRLREHSDVGDFTPSQIAVLQRLEADGPATTSHLARAESMRPQSMGAVIAALEAAGFVAGAPDPSDGRQTLVSLTDHCRTWLAEGRAARQDWLAGVLEARLSVKEQAQLADALQLLARVTRA